MQDHKLQENNLRFLSGLKLTNIAAIYTKIARDAANGLAKFSNQESLDQDALCLCALLQSLKMKGYEDELQDVENQVSKNTASVIKVNHTFRFFAHIQATFDFLASKKPFFIDPNPSKSLSISVKSHLTSKLLTLLNKLNIYPIIQSHLHRHYRFSSNCILSEIGISCLSDLYKLTLPIQDLERDKISSKNDVVCHSLVKRCNLTILCQKKPTECTGCYMSAPPEHVIW